MALAHHEAGRLQQAEDLYRQVLVAEPSNVNALHLLGVVASEQGKDTLAIECIAKAIGLAPGFADAHYNLGRIFHERGKIDDAVRCYLRALHLRPDYFEASSNLALTFQSLGKLSDAEAWFRRAAEVRPRSAEAHYGLAKVLKDQGKRDDAIACYRRAVLLKPDFGSALVDLGNVLNAQGSGPEAITCYRRALEINPDDVLALNNLGTILKDLGNVDEAISCFQQAIERGPLFVEAHFNAGLAYCQQSKFEKAIESYARALELRPNFPQAWYELGSAYEAVERLEDAVVSYHRAIALSPAYAEAINNLGTVYQKQEKLDAAICEFRRALKLKPDLIAAHNNLGTAMRECGRIDNAAAAFRNGIALAPDRPELHFNYAGVLLIQGDFEHGWPEYESRWETGKLHTRHFSQPQWHGEALEGKRILLHAEQGFGDTLQFIRYASIVKRLGPTVIVECQRPLTRLLNGCPGIDCLVAGGDELPSFDLHSPLLSLPAVLKTTVSTIPSDVPYLFVDPNLVAHWRRRLDEFHGFRIGINWRGRAGKRESRQRDIPLNEFASLGQVGSVQLISLQKGAGEEELAAVRRCTSLVNLTEIDTEHGAFMDTGAIMKSIDLVITSDTSIAHLAGTLAVPVWVALPFAAEWRWLLDRSDSPWYPTMRLFRQKQLGDWAGVFEEIKAELQKRIKERDKG